MTARQTYEETQKVYLMADGVLLSYNLVASNLSQPV